MKFLFMLDKLLFYIILSNHPQATVHQVSFLFI